MSPASARQGLRCWPWLVVLCVVLASITSIAVAWGLELLAPVSFTGGRFLSRALFVPPNLPAQPELQWAMLVNRLHSPGVEHSFFASYGFASQHESSQLTPFDVAVTDPLSQRAVVRHVAAVGDGYIPVLIFEVRRSGWPWPCLGSERASPILERGVIGIDTTPTISFDEFMSGSRQLTRPTFAEPPPPPAWTLKKSYNAIEVGEHLLSTFPLWPGLLANTAFYGGAWAVLIFTPLFIRRWLRARRGGCAGCGYSREGLKEGAPCPECGRECSKGAGTR